MTSRTGAAWSTFLLTASGVLALGTLGTVGWAVKNFNKAAHSNAGKNIGIVSECVESRTRKVPPQPCPAALPDAVVGLVDTGNMMKEGLLMGFGATGMGLAAVAAFKKSKPTGPKPPAAKPPGGKP